MVRCTFAALSKGFVFIILFAIVLITSNPATAQTPAGYWTFDDGLGAKAVDATGNGHTATLINGVSWAPGKIGGAVSANAAFSQSVRLPAVDLAATRAITVTFWSKRAYSTAGGHVLLEATPDFTQSTTGFALFPDDTACSGIQAAIKGEVGITANCYGQPTSSVWHHFALVLDKTQSAGNQVALYVDGALQNPTRSLAASTNTNYFGNNPIYLFSRGGTSMFDTGTIDDLRVYSTALTSSQIQQIYTSTLAGISEGSVVSVDSYGTMTTPAITTSVNSELLVAFISYDGPSGVTQSAKVTGGGLTWTLRSRSNKQWGTSEIWSATSPTAPFTTTVTSQPVSSGNWHGSLTVIGFLNATVVGKVGQNSASSGAPDVSLASVAAGNWVFAVGNDWDNPIARTPVSGQVLVHQRVDTVVGDTYWVQATAAPSTVTGTVDIHDSAPTSDQWNYAAVEIVSSTAEGTLSATPTSVGFGSVNVSTSATQTVTLTNTGGAPLTVSAASISGTGFSLAGVSVPFTLSPGSTQALSVTFAPTVTGAASGSISVTSNASDPNLSISLSGTGTTPGTLSSSPVSVNFGNVDVGSSAAQTVTISNSGPGPVTVSSVSMSGTGFSLGSVSTPFTLASGAAKSLTVTFAPKAAGAASGSITIASNATNPTLGVPLSGTGVVVGTLTASPASVSFGNVNIKSSASQSVTLTNTGGSAVTVSGIAVSGAGFSISSVSTPFTLAPGATKAISTTFAPTVAGAATGSISVTSNASDPSLSAALSGTGTTPGPLTASPSSLNFGNVVVNASSSLPVTITNSGTGPVTVSAISVGGSGYSLTPVSTPFTLAAGASTTLTATFSPTVTGTATGTVTVTSNAVVTTLAIGLSGTGVTSVTHQVTLSWNASTSVVAGYNVYKATSVSGPFSVINSGLDSGTSYVDLAVTSGSTYYYYTTAVDSSGNESVPSNQVSATIP